MRYLLFPCLLLAFGWTGCESADEPAGPGPCASSLDQETLFAAMAQNVIEPAYAELADRSERLHETAAAFNDSPSATSLTVLRAAFVDTYLAWQAAAPYQFGPAEEQLLRSSFNNFPLDVPALEAKLSATTYSFDNPAAYDTGLPALDYLLYQEREENSALSYLTDTPGAQAYLHAVTLDLAQRARLVSNAWRLGYRQTFVANTGTAAGTSLSALINRLNAHYEGVKRDRLGLPAGVMTIGIANPDKVEAYYSGRSLELLDAALLASERFYTGADGPGLDDYLAGIDNADAVELDREIRQRYQTALSATKALDGELSQLVTTEQATVTEAYAEVTRQLVNIKTDLPALTCVSITYIDNPSDSD